MNSQILAWHVHPDVWLVVGMLAGGYAWAIKRVGPRILPKGTPAATRKQVVLFGLGAFALLAASDWPIHDVAERSLYSVHMIQHMILTFAFAPLLLLGTPAWLFRKLIAPVAPLVRALSRPAFGLIQFNIVLVLLHWPLVVNAIVGQHALHFFVHVALVVSAILMWMPVCSPVLEIPRLSYPGQTLYLFLQSLVPTIPASFLTFGSKPLYRAYVALPKLWSISARTDQMVAGLIMKIVGGFILWGIILSLFFKWYRMEHETGVDAMAWRNVDKELNRMELRHP